MRRLALALLLLVALPRFAAAHATLVRSTPAAGARLAVAPREIVLVFSEEIEGKLAKVSIVSGIGQVYTVPVHADPHDVNALLGSLAGLPDGAYWLEWRVVSADGHPVEGRFQFAVGTGSALTSAPPPTEGHDEAAPEPIAFPRVAAVLRGVTLGLLMALAGLLGFRRGAVALSERSVRRTSRVALLLAVAAAVACVAHLAGWLMHVSPSHSVLDSAAGLTLASTVGKLELWRTGLAVLAVWALWLARRETLAMLFAVAALVVSGAIGHSAAIDPMITTPAKVVHLLAGAAWLGGLAWLLGIARDDARLLPEGRRVSGVALVSVVLVAVSGVAQALLFLPSLRDLVGTTYGLLVIAKTAGLAVLVMLGAQHRFRSLPRLALESSAARPFRRSLAAEVVVMTLVIILGGVLAYVSPTH